MSLEFILLRFRSRSRDLDDKVLVLVSRAEWQGLVHSRMQQTLRKCSEYSKNRILIKTSGLWEYGHGQQFEHFVGSFKQESLAYAKVSARQ